MTTGPQFLRPNSTISQLSFTGGFADIDEAVASDTDFMFGAVNAAASISLGLSDPAVIPGGVRGVFRWRSARRNGNGVINSGNGFTAQAGLLQGGTSIAFDQYTPGNWATREVTFTIASVTNFSALTLSFQQTPSGGTTADTRSGLAVSWAEVEIPGARRVVIIQ